MKFKVKASLVERLKAHSIDHGANFAGPDEDGLCEIEMEDAVYQRMDEKYFDDYGMTIEEGTFEHALESLLEEVEEMTATRH